MNKKNSKKIVLVFGNPLIKTDSLPIELAAELSKKLSGYDFLKADPSEELDKFGTHLTIIDTVVGIKKTAIFSEKDLESLEHEKRFSVHGFDLGFSLKLLLKLGKIKTIKIIGIPQNYGKKKALKETLNAIKNLTKTSLTK